MQRICESPMVYYHGTFCFSAIDYVMMKGKQMNPQNTQISYFVKIAILSAIAFVMMLFEVPLPFIAPSFYELDFSEVIALIGSFALGPVAGVLIELLKNILNIVITNTDTVGVGEFANFVTGCAYLLPAAILYRYRRDRKHAVIGIVFGTLSLALVGSLLNYFVMIPLYSNLFHLPVSTIVGMGQSIFPVIDTLWELVLLCVVPFNLIKGVLCGILTLLLYKRLAAVLKR